MITFRSWLRLFDKLEVRRVGGHCAGSSIVTFRQGAYRYVVGGDECYLNACLRDQIPTGSFYDLEKSRRFIQTYSRPGNRVFLFHDPDAVQETLGYRIILSEGQNGKAYAAYSAGSPAPGVKVNP